MNQILRRCANAAIIAAVRIAPPERHMWAKAMVAELAHMPDDEVFSFALGCLWTMARARAVTSAFILSAARWGLVMSAAIWSALNLWLAGRLSHAGATSPAALAYSAAAVFAVGAIATGWFGLRVTVKLAAPLSIVAILFALNADQMLPLSPHQHFYRAIAVEYATMLCVGVAIAAGVPHWVAKRKGVRP